jgi:DNA repair ATPase RecN
MGDCGMNELRKQFEALAKVSKIIKEYGSEVVFNSEENCYETPCYRTFIPEYLHEINFGWYAFQERQKKLEEVQRKYDALYNAFTVTDDARKEWHRCYMGVRQREDELQENIDQINQRAIDQAEHLNRAQEHNAKLQKRLKENGIPWQDLI